MPPVPSCCLNWAVATYGCLVSTGYYIVHVFCLHLYLLNYSNTCKSCNQVQCTSSDLRGLLIDTQHSAKAWPTHLVSIPSTQPRLGRPILYRYPALSQGSADPSPMDAQHSAKARRTRLLWMPSTQPRLGRPISHRYQALSQGSADPSPIATKHSAKARPTRLLWIPCTQPRLGRPIYYGYLAPRQGHWAHPLETRYYWSSAHSSSMM
jgi:hypothetical protein